MTHQALLLTPSRGFGGGIERYAETLEWAFSAQGVRYLRADLHKAGEISTRAAYGHARLLAQARAQLRASRGPTRLVVMHRALLPVASLLAREKPACGISVVCHGTDVWGARSRLRACIETRLMRSAGVRAVAVSGFTAGALPSGCLATILPPGLSLEWFRELASAAGSARPQQPEVLLVTVFRLEDWRSKGLVQLLAAVAALGRQDVRLTICGAGEPSAELLRLVWRHPFCTLRPGLANHELARQLAAADLFVLATRTASGRNASGEGFGLVLLEAQVAGTPVVAPAYGGSSDAFLEGLTGAAPTDETTAALSRLLGDLLRDPDQLMAMGTRAAQWARASFAPERYAPLAIERLL